jgi:hypothetical protein
LAPRLASVDAAAQLFVACGHAGEIVWQQQGKSILDVCCESFLDMNHFVCQTCDLSMW